MVAAPEADGREYAATVDANTVIQSLIPIVAGSDLPVRVVDGETQVGVIDRTAVLDAMVEDHP